MSNTFSPTANPALSADDKFMSALPTGSKVTVVGAGAFGGWSALHLLRRGYEVTLVEASGAGHSMASSGGESRLIRCIYGDNLFYTQMAAEAYGIWTEEQKRFKKDVLYPTGCLWFADADNHAVMDAAKAIMKNCDLEVEEMSPAECHVRYPLINPIGLESVILEKKTGYLLAREACAEVLDLYLKEGGNYVIGKCLPEIKGDDCTLVFENGDRMSADSFLFACGPWMKKLFPDILESPIKVTRQEVFYFKVSSKYELAVSALPTWIDHCAPDHYYGIPSGIRRGFKIAFDRRGPEVDPDTMERTPTSSEIELAREYLGKRFPVLAHAPLVESRVCQYSNTAEANFFFDQHPLCSQIMLLGGGSGHGYKHGPALGKLVSDCISAKKAIPGQLLLRHV